MSTKPDSIRIPDEIRTPLRAIAAEHHLPFQVLIRAVLRDYVEKYKSRGIKPVPGLDGHGEQHDA